MRELLATAGAILVIVSIAVWGCMLLWLLRLCFGRPRG